jgi:hypothetical protein
MTSLSNELWQIGLTSMGRGAVLAPDALNGAVSATLRQWDSRTGQHLTPCIILKTAGLFCQPAITTLVTE